jgi:hypothetical protein
MRIRQRAYLSLASDGLCPDEITAILGLEPDESKIRGSRFAGPPPRPASHLWSLLSGVRDDAPLEDHLTALWPRLVQVAEGLQIFTARPDSAGFLQIVRNFEEGSEDFDEAAWGLPPNADFERLGGQHPFLGFGFDALQLQFLGSIGVAIDVDEYG